MSELGRRVSCAGSRGTVLYSGSVEKTTGEWLGIDWDSSERGKHDGSHNGRRYFTASFPTSGSFVRRGAVEWGGDVMSAVRARYSPTENDDVSFSEEQHRMGARVIEFVKMEKIAGKQKNPARLHVVILSEALISCSGLSDDSEEALPMCNELDLSRTLLSDWTQVFHVIGRLPKLCHLNLSFNRFLPTPRNGNYTGLTTLVLNDCRLEWMEVINVSSNFPELEELYISRNAVISIQLPAEEERPLQKLKLLDLEANQIDNFGSILRLHELLPRLEHLNVSKTGQTEVTFGDLERPFPLLKTFCLKSNQISSWDSVNELNRLASLRAVHLNENPVLNSEKIRTAKQLVVAKLKSLQYLDRETIDASERRGAEIDYLQKFAVQWYAGDNDDEKRRIFLQKHPRYLELIRDYGNPDVFKNDNVFDGVLKNNLLQLYFVGPNGTAPILKQMPRSMNVQKLKVIAAKLFRVNLRKVVLHGRSQEQPNVQIEFDNDYREVSFFGLANGDSILVSTAN